MTNKLTEEQILQGLTGKIGHERVIYDSIDSTNNAAKLLAKNGAPHGAVVFARQQTAGRGRLGRSFYSPKNAGLYMTVILRPALSAESALLITSAAAVATARGIEQVTDKAVKIKWVNDLYWEGKKLCGILAESALDKAGGVEYLVVGIGINLSPDSYPPEITHTATSLSAMTHKDTDVNQLAAAVLNQLDFIYNELESRAFMEEYRSRSCVIGKQVRLLQGTESQDALVRDIDRDGRLITELPDGRQLVIHSGEVSLKGDWR